MRLAIRRPDLAAFSLTTGQTAQYQSLLEINDPDGTKRYVGITADTAQTSYSTRIQNARIRKLDASATPTNPMAGLWIGDAAIKLVNQPSHPSEPLIIRPTSREFPMRLLVHIDAQSKARLLQRVLIMWKDGTYKPDPNNPKVNIVDKPGRYVLLTDETRANMYSGSTIRGGQQVGQRISSAAFGFNTPILATQQTGNLTVGSMLFFLTMAHNDPLNPFVHKYHPDHDNLDVDFATALPESVESFRIDRQITLKFSETDPDNLSQSGWGDSVIGGKYLETISGIHKENIFVGGTFRLRRIADVAVLDDGQL